MKWERVQAGGIELEVIRGGSGPPILMLHGPTTYNPETPFLGLLGQVGTKFDPRSP